MTDTETLLRILAEHLHGRSSKEPVTDTLLADAGRHEVEAIVYRQTRAPKLERAFYYALASDRKRRRLDREIREALSNAKVPCFSVKGLFVADYYPAPALRTMGDIDYVTTDRAAVKSVLEKLGYTFSEANGVTDWHFSKNEIEFELHDRLLYDVRFGTETQVRYLNDCWRHYENGAIDVNFHFVYLVAHLRKHLLEGVGFRQFYDFAVLAKNAKDVFDWDQIRQELRKINLLSFTEVCFALCQKWFKVAPPFEVPKLPKGFAREAAEEICQNGVFGEEREAVTIALNKHMTGSAKHGYLAAQGARFLQRAFPSYEEMTLYPQYRFLVGRRFLMPIAWIYRFFRNMFRKEKWKKLEEETSVSEEAFNERNRSLERWGL